MRILDYFRGEGTRAREVLGNYVHGYLALYLHQCFKTAIVLKE